MSEDPFDVFKRIFKPMTPEEWDNAKNNPGVYQHVEYRVRYKDVKHPYWTEEEEAAFRRAIERRMERSNIVKGLSKMFDHEAGE